MSETTNQKRFEDLFEAAKERGNSLPSTHAAAVLIADKLDALVAAIEGSGEDDIALPPMKEPLGPSG